MLKLLTLLGAGGNAASGIAATTSLAAGANGCCATPACCAGASCAACGCCAGLWKKLTWKTMKDGASAVAGLMPSGGSTSNTNTININLTPLPAHYGGSWQPQTTVTQDDAGNAVARPPSPASENPEDPGNAVARPSQVGDDDGVQAPVSWTTAEAALREELLIFEERNKQLTEDLVEARTVMDTHNAEARAQDELTAELNAELVAAAHREAAWVDEFATLRQAAQARDEDVEMELAAVLASSRQTAQVMNEAVEMELAAVRRDLHEEAEELVAVRREAAHKSEDAAEQPDEPQVTLEKEVVLAVTNTGIRYIDPDTGRVTDLNRLKTKPGGRVSFDDRCCAALDRDAGVLYVLGGKGADELRADAYKIHDGTWTELPTLKADVSYGRAAMIDGGLVVYKNNTLQQYDA